MPKPYNYKIERSGEVVKRTNDEKIAQKNIAALQAAETPQFTFTDNVKGTITTYTKEAHQKNYYAQAVRIDSSKPVPKA